MVDSTNNEIEAFDNLIEIGSEIVGGGTGAAIGLLISGPIGAVAGGAVAPFVTITVLKLAKDFKQRVLGKREEMRIGATLRYGIIKINENMAAGQQIRQDDFFQKQPDDRSTAEEVFEGILLTAQREYQEKKLKFYGNLLANIAFRVDIDRDLANALIRQVQSMSYRQICILSLSIRKGEFSTSAKGGWLSLNSDNVIESSLQADVTNLHQQHILSSAQGSEGELNASMLGSVDICRFRTLSALQGCIEASKSAQKRILSRR